MYYLILTRLLTSAVAIFGASVFAFVIMRVVPGDPARLVLGPFASQTAVDALVGEMGLHEPLHVQYARYMESFFTGDWGFSYSTGESVAGQLDARLPATLELGFYAFAFAFVGAIVLAVLGTYRRGIADRSVRGLSHLGLGTPPFWLSLVLLVVFSERLGWFPGPEGRLAFDEVPPRSITRLYTVDALITGDVMALGSALTHLILPAAALGLMPMAFLLRLLRANLMDVAGEPFLVVVRSKGVSRFRTHLRHALPNAFIPTLTASGLLLGQLLAGSVLVEKVFNWPGAGALVADAILRQDFAVVQAFILLSVFVYVVINAVVDILTVMIDPRVREPSAA